MNDDKRKNAVGDTFWLVEYLSLGPSAAQPACLVAQRYRATCSLELVASFLPCRMLQHSDGLNVEFQASI